MRIGLYCNHLSFSAKIAQSKDEILLFQPIDELSYTI